MTQTPGQRTAGNGWTAVLTVAYVDGRPVGRSTLRLLQQALADGPQVIKRHRVLMRRLHTAYPRRWR